MPLLSDCILDAEHHVLHSCPLRGPLQGGLYTTLTLACFSGVMVYHIYIYIRGFSWYNVTANRLHKASMTALYSRKSPLQLHISFRISPHHTIIISVFRVPRVSHPVT